MFNSNSIQNLTQIITFTNNQFYLTLSILIPTVVYFVYRFYLNVGRYPLGPYPYPLVGNMILLLSYSHIKRINPNECLIKLRQQYGPVFTIWVFTKPFVVIADGELLRDAFQKPEFSDRGFKYPQMAMTLSRGHDMILCDHNDEWREKRKMVVMALRKYVMTDNLDQLVNKCTEDVFNRMMANEQLDKPFDLSTYMYLVINKIILQSLFGKAYKSDDEELKYFADAQKNVERTVDLLNLLDGLPDVIASFIFKLIGHSSFFGFPDITRRAEIKYFKHLKSYKDGLIRDVTDALIAAKREAVAENRESADHLTDLNLVHILTDFVSAGTDTTKCLLEWIFRLMVELPEMQLKMRQEIRRLIGGQNKPNQQDKDKCHFTMAFIHETLRLFTPAPVAVPHKTKIDVEVNHQRIPKHTLVICHLHGVNRSDQWPNPELFDPKRFLNENGAFEIKKLSQFLPFSVGRRSCPGDKLAVIDAFLITARLLQLTDEQGLEFAIDGRADNRLDADPKILFLSKPVHYKIMLKKQAN